MILKPKPFASLVSVTKCFSLLQLKRQQISITKLQYCDDVFARKKVREETLETLGVEKFRSISNMSGIHLIQEGAGKITVPNL